MVTVSILETEDIYIYIKSGLEVCLLNWNLDQTCIAGNEKASEEFMTFMTETVISKREFILFQI